MKWVFPNVLVVAASVFLFSCSDGGTKSGIDEANRGAISGKWSGTWSSSTGVKGKMTATFTQSGTTFYGPITLYNSPCFGYEYATGRWMDSKKQS